MDIGEIAGKAEMVVGIPVDVCPTGRGSWLDVDGNGRPTLIVWDAPERPTPRDVARLCHEIGHAVSHPSGYPARLSAIWRDVRRRATRPAPPEIWEDEMLAWEAGWKYAVAFGVPRREYLIERAACLRTFCL